MKLDHHRNQLNSVLNFSAIDDLPGPILDQLARLPVSSGNKVLIIYTGGTFGMHQNSEGFLVPTNNAEDLLKPLNLKGLDKQVTANWFQVFPEAIDSTNARWPHWVSVANIIRLLYDNYDGFVVINGTDTMAHLTAALSLAFPNLGKPIIATGSQLPMFMLGDDATRNLYFALAAACSDLSGVHLAFADVLRDGSHVFKVQDKRFDAFTSPSTAVMGEFDGEVRLFSNAPRRVHYVDQRRLVYNPFFMEGVGITRLSPATASTSLAHQGMDPSIAALLVITYGAGNVRDQPSYKGEIEHLKAIKDLRQKGIPVILGSPMMDGRVDSPYSCGAKAVSEDVGALSALSVTGPMLEVICMHALQQAWDGNDHLDMTKFESVFREIVHRMDNERNR